jgi:hypothetical protein
MKTSILLLGSVKLKAGFAIIAWGIDGGASSTIRVFDSRQVGSSMVPDFARSSPIQDLATD